MPRTMRTLPGCQTLDSDSWVFKSFEQNTVQQQTGVPVQDLGGGGTVGSGWAEVFVPGA